MREYQVPINSNPLESAETDVPAPTEESVDFISSRLTRDDSVGLGRKAVLKAMWDANELVQKDELPSLIARLGERQRRWLDSTPKANPDIEEIRTSIEMLDSDLAADIYERMQEEFILGAVYDYQEMGPHEPLSSRLKRKSKHDNRYYVSDNTVLNFAEWWMSLTLERQKNLDSRIEERKASYKNKILDAIQAGWIPKRASKQLENIDMVDVLYDDLFSTEVEGRAGYYQAYRNPDVSPTIVLTPIDSVYTPIRQEELSSHEFNHAFMHSREGSFNIILLKSLFGKRGAKLVDEAMTEHLAQSLVYGDFDTMHPNERKEKGTYTGYRSFMDALINRGQIKIDPRDLYDALYFTSYKVKSDFTESEKMIGLLGKFEQAYPGLDIHSKIKKLKTDEDIVDLMKQMEVNREKIIVRKTRDMIVAKERERLLVASAQKWGGEFDEK